MTGELESLRKEIEDIDSKIVELMVNRNDAAERVGELKKELNIPLRNKDVEKAVTERYRRAAEGTSLSADTAEAVCRLLISSSVELQSLTVRKQFGKKVTIIGGEGKMGRWIVGYFKSLGSAVNVIDVSAGSKDYLRDSDVVVISVPISSVCSVLKDADRICRKDALIFDISSIKSPFSSQLRKMAERRKVCSVHPMFGPSVVSVADRNIMICDCGCEAAVSEAEEIFSNGGPNITVTTVERHDELMAYVLGFAHASNITFFTALRRSGIPFRELEGASSVTFERTLKASVPVSEENAKLYHDIQRLNISTEEMWDVYEKAVKDVKEASLSDSSDRFAELMHSGRRYLMRKDHL